MNTKSFSKTVAALAIVASVSTSACGMFQNPMAKLYAGETPLKVTNRHQTAVCELYMVDAARSDWGSSWVGKSGLDPGASVEFKIKPGKYRLAYQGCGAGMAKVGADGTIVAAQDTGPAYRGSLREFDVEKPTELVLFSGAKLPAATTGYELVAARSRGKETTGREAFDRADGDCQLGCTSSAGLAGPAYEACMARCVKKR